MRLWSMWMTSKTTTPRSLRSATEFAGEEEARRQWRSQTQHVGGALFLLSCSSFPFLIFFFLLS
jgi:hypothetical protein